MVKVVAWFLFVRALVLVRLWWPVARRLLRRPDYPYDRSYGHHEHEVRRVVSEIERKERGHGEAE